MKKFYIDTKRSTVVRYENADTIELISPIKPDGTTYNGHQYLSKLILQDDDTQFEFYRTEPNEDGMYVPNTDKIQEVALKSFKDDFYENRCTILDSIGWIHERIQSQTVLIQGGKALTASFTVAQATEYYEYKQALRDRPSIITDWTSISYPTVPECVYNDMTDAIKQLCQDLQCDPVV